MFACLQYCIRRATNDVFGCLHRVTVWVRIHQCKSSDLQARLRGNAEIGRSTLAHANASPFAHLFTWPPSLSLLELSSPPLRLFFSNSSRRLYEFIAAISCWRHLPPQTTTHWIPRPCQIQKSFNFQATRSIVRGRAPSGRVVQVSNDGYETPMPAIFIGIQNTRSF